MVGRAREVLPQSPTLSRGNLRLVGGDVSLVSLIPPVSLIGNTSAMFRGTAKIFTELVQHPSGNNGCHTRGTTSPARFPPRWTVEETAPCSSFTTPIGRRWPSSIARMSPEGGRRASTRDEAWRIAANSQAAGAAAATGRVPCQLAGKPRLGRGELWVAAHVGPSQRRQPHHNGLHDPAR
jgi:hypothetical protein